MSTMLDPHGQPIIRRFNAARLSDRMIDELIGLARGVVSDGVVVQAEAEFLADWIERNRRIANTWPANILYTRLQEMLADGFLDAEEQHELLETLHELTGGTRIVPPDAASRSVTLPLSEPPPKISFPGFLFCFTGKFIHGTRRECESEVISRAAGVQTSPTSVTNYLVIGEIGSTDWIHTSYGRKIEKAVEFRSKGSPIEIVSESLWIEAL